MAQMNLSTKEKQTHRENRSAVPEGVGRGGMTEIGRHRLLDTGWMDSQAVLYSPGNHVHYPAISHNGKECGRKDSGTTRQLGNSNTCIVDSLCWTAETNIENLHF